MKLQATPSCCSGSRTFQTTSTPCSHRSLSCSAKGNCVGEKISKSRTSKNGPTYGFLAWSRTSSGCFLRMCWVKKAPHAREYRTQPTTGQVSGFCLMSWNILPTCDVRVAMVVVVVGLEVKGLRLVACRPKGLDASLRWGKSGKKVKSASFFSHLYSAQYKVALS